MKKKIIILAIVTIIVIGGVFFTTAAARDGKASAENMQTVFVTTISTTDRVEATGEFDVHPYAELAWNTSGNIASIHVKGGDQVKSGDILMTLETTSVSANIITAQAQLIQTRETMEDLLESDTARAKAWIAYQDAEEEFEDAQDYRDSLDEEITIDDVKIVRIMTPGGVKKMPKIKSYKYTPDEEMISNADANLALVEALYQDAKREYEKLENGTPANDLEAAQANIDAAQATVNLMYIIAPFDGTVLYVDGAVGEMVKTGSPAVIIADPDHYYAEVLVDEADISLVEKGQNAVVTSDGMPEVEFTGWVESINPVGKNANGLVKYTIQIALDPTEIQIMLGSTADAIITVGEQNKHLAVPLSAIHNDTTGEYVQVLRDGSIVQVNVVTGDILGDLVVVAGDLVEGDEVVISYETEMNLPGFSG